MDETLSSVISENILPYICEPYVAICLRVHRHPSRPQKLQNIIMEHCVYVPYQEVKELIALMRQLDTKVVNMFFHLEKESGKEKLDDPFMYLFDRKCIRDILFEDHPAINELKKLLLEDDSPTVHTKYRNKFSGNFPYYRQHTRDPSNKYIVEGIVISTGNSIISMFT